MSEYDEIKKIIEGFKDKEEVERRQKKLNNWRYEEYYTAYNDLIEGHGSEDELYNKNNREGWY
tara:strand:+ start:868 stop:1056 length:189 start_codon:yes stop_codon:yes gene_type:complete